MTVASNSDPDGVNSSSKVLTWTAEGTYETSPIINLTGYTSGYTFTLSFDLYNPTSLTHSLLIGYGPNGTNADIWYIGSPNLHAGETYDATLSNTATWQHFSFDFSAAITDYLSRAQPAHAPTNFSLFLQEWSDGGGHLSRLDNLTLTATAIPEPSTYAALAGAVALGLAALRRRRAAA